ncbi:MAG: hypothetical protein N4J56_004566 [Chroococcidiopsis sp. SAG 2025]|uniref:hypothetical protein n=1 Tax=Chroococcidiopsis sp. SAG 2025 TaxID=171389 RepID=UPI002938AD8C|nr:hypothetical protein [Chroococcidiopsis sp. SAG 2025]
MTLKFNHFDTRLNQWLHTDGNTNNPDSVLSEELDNTLLEFFFPDKEFSFGQMDEYSTPEDLKNHPDGHVLLFSSQSRLLYGSPECLETIEKLCPDRKDRGAYGSIFLGSCKNAIHEQLNILVVDDATGANGGILPDAVAYRLVGDCYGQISPQLYDKLTQRRSEEKYRVIQHRFGWRSRDGEDIHYRFGKGTLRPHDLAVLDYANPNSHPRIDLILPVSSFKGTDKDNPNAPIKPQIQPGLYSQRIWLGEKSQSQQGKTAISQLLASFPQGMKDIVEELEVQAIRLAQIQDDPRKVAQLYCEQYEKRKAIANERRSPTDIAETPPDSENGNLDDYDSQTEKNDLLTYRLIKADLQGHCQLLETEKVKHQLSRFVQKQWRDIAIGRTLSFDRGTIIPSKELKNGEICVPWCDEGEKILNFRSPFLNSNGLCVSLNKHVQDYIAPDGRPLEGIIVVNDEDRKRIQARIAALKARGIETQEVDPIETESERQGRDFDGDCIGVELASKYPNLTAEAEARNLPQNAYTPTLKLKKQSFYREDGTQPLFEEIAIFMSDSISVGVINNQVTALEALESEIEIFKTYGNFQQQSEYLDTVANHYQQLFERETQAKNPKSIREECRARMKEIVDLASVENRTPVVLERSLSINRSIYRSLIEEGCFQNQIAVDTFKSARAPDMKLIQENQRYLYRDVSYIKEKKLPFAYLNEAIAPGGDSPVELLIAQTNKYFQQSQLESRPIVQFQDLFKDIEFTPQQKFAALLTKHEFDRKFNEATRLEQRCQSEQGPYAIVQTKCGAQIEITNLTRYGHPLIWNAQTLNLKLEEIPEQQRTEVRSHKLLAVAQIDGEMENGQPKYRPLGTISQQSAFDYKLKAGMTSIGATPIEIKPQLKPSQIKLLFGQAHAIAENFRAAIPESERLSAAAAAWSISATREDELEKKSKISQLDREMDLDNPNNNEAQQQEDTRKKVSNFVFAAFGSEILSRLNQLQFANLKITGIEKEGEIFQQKPWDLEEKHEIEIRPSDRSAGNERHNTTAVFVKDNDGEYREYGVLEQRTGRLPIGTKARASILPGETYTAKATLAEAGKPAIDFTIREVSKFSHADKVFNNESVILSVGQVPIPNGTVKIKLGDRTLGELDADSVEALRQANYLNNGNFLKLKLRTIEDSRHEGAFIIGESPNGNLLRINKINYYDFKGEEFQDQDYSIGQIEMTPAKVRDVVFLDGKPLGVLFYKQDKEALKQLGILQLGRQVAVECNLQSNFSHAFIKVDPATVQYPEVWTKQKGAIASVTAPDELIEKSELFLSKIKERPTILFANPEDKVLGLVGLAVDDRKVEVVDNWLRSRSIEFSPVSSQEASLETKKGLAVRYLAASSIKPQDMEALKAKIGTPLDAATYSTRLVSLPNRPQAIAEKPTKLVKSQTLDSNAPQAQVASITPAPRDRSHLEESNQDATTIPDRSAKPALNGKYSALHQMANGERQVSQFIEQQRWQCKQLYEQLSRQVRQYPDFNNASNWEVDVGVALLVLKESFDANEVGRVLSQCDRLQEWKASLPEEEYKTKGKIYIQEVYTQAQNLLETQQHQHFNQGQEM